MSTDETSPQGKSGGNDAQAQPTSNKTGGDGTSAAAVGYQYSAQNKPRRAAAITPVNVDRVYQALLDSLDDAVCYRASSDLDVNGLTGKQIGSALRELACADDCPLAIEQWTGKQTTPTRWRVARADPDPVTDGGPDHDVPVEEQLTDRQQALVEDNGGSGDE